MVNKEDKRREKLGWPAWVELGVPKALRTGLNFNLVFTSVGYRHRQLSQGGSDSKPDTEVGDELETMNSPG